MNEQEARNRALGGPIEVLALELTGPDESLSLELSGPALIVPRVRGAVIGQVLVSPQEARGVDDLLRTLDRVLEHGASRAFTRNLVTAALRGDHPAPTPEVSSVTVLVTRTDDNDTCGRCLDSIAALERSADEVRLIDGPGEALGGGELIAFVDSACGVDPAWLNGIEGEFRDPRTMAVTGYVGPVRLDGDAQIKAVGDSLTKRVSPFVVDGAYFDGPKGFCNPTSGALIAAQGGNVIVRRAFLDRLGKTPGGRTGTIAASLSELTVLRAILASGYRIAFDPSRVCWFNLPDDPGEARKASRLAARDARVFRTGQAINRARRPSLRSMYGNPEPAPARAADGPGRDSPPDVSVLVPSHHRRLPLLALLDKLAQQTLSSDRFEVVVVLDDDREETAKAVRKLGLPFHLELFEQPHRGVAAARNEAVRRSRAPLLVFVDDDMEPEPSFLDAHVRAHADEQEQIVVIGYCPSDPGYARPFSRTLQAWWESHYVRLTDPAHQWTWIDFSVGNSSMPRDLLEREGGFDEAFARRNEDQDMGLCLARRGVRSRYVPEARAWHRFETNPLSSLGDARRQGYYDVRLVEKYPQLLHRVQLELFRTAEGRLRSKPARIWRFPRLTEAFLPIATRFAGLLERMGSRRRWLHVNNGARAAAYLLGVREALGGCAQRLEGLRPPEATEQSVDIAERGALRIQPSGEEPILEVSYRGGHLATVPAMRAGKVWDWDDLIERTTTACAAELSRTTGPGELRSIVRLRNSP